MSAPTPAGGTAGRTLVIQVPCHNEEEVLPRVLADVLADGDLLLVMGAGDIGGVAAELATNGIHGVNKA